MGIPNKGYFVCQCLYIPRAEGSSGLGIELDSDRRRLLPDLPALFKKAWTLPDVEKGAGTGLHAFP
jgi:hypothetical protein